MFEVKKKGTRFKEQGTRMEDPIEYLQLKSLGFKFHDLRAGRQVHDSHSAAVKLSVT